MCPTSLDTSSPGPTATEAENNIGRSTCVCLLRARVTALLGPFFVRNAVLLTLCLFGCCSCSSRDELIEYIQSAGHVRVTRDTSQVSQATSLPSLKSVSIPRVFVALLLRAVRVTRIERNCFAFVRVTESDVVSVARDSDAVHREATVPRFIRRRRRFQTGKRFDLPSTCSSLLCARLSCQLTPKSNAILFLLCVSGDQASDDEQAEPGRFGRQ